MFRTFLSIIPLLPVYPGAPISQRRSSTKQQNRTRHFLSFFLSLYTARPCFEYYRQVYFVHSGLQDESLQVTIHCLRRRDTKRIDLSAMGHHESGSFRPWVVSAGSFRPNFGVSRFGLFWWVVSAVSRFGHGSFRPSVCVGGEGVWGYSQFFCIRRLGPSIYCLPIKNITQIRHSQINI